ncbi:MAG: ABC transporter permease [Acidisphaera sp.]|nr:ABC transporter permease [Acidisphaera sp.]
MPLADPATLRWRGVGNAAASLVYAFLIAPSLIVIPLSFGTGRELVFPPRGFSLAFYAEYFHTSTWMMTTAQSLLVASCSTALACCLGFAAAYALIRCSFPGKRWVNVVLLSPVMVPAITVALGSYLYFSTIHLAPTPGLILAHAVHTTPFIMVTVMAGLRAVDSRLETAAIIMGAGWLTVLRRVILPLVRPALLAGAMFAFLISFDEVVIAYFVTDSATQTLPVKMYSSIQWEVSPVIAAISTLLTVLSLVVCVAGAGFAKPAAAG